MARWEEGAERRLREAALELFAQNGYERTKIADITARARLNYRSFFRHFSDKREVLFAGEPELRQVAMVALVGADPRCPILDRAMVAVRAAASWLDARADDAVATARIIRQSSELRERELVKLEVLTDEIAAVLHGSGAAGTDAAVVARSAVGLFVVAYAQWSLPDQQCAQSTTLVEILNKCERTLRRATNPSIQ